MTNEGMMSRYNLYQTYFFDNTTTMTTNMYSDAFVYDTETDVTIRPVAEDIIETYWVLGMIGENFGGLTQGATYGLPTNIYKPYFVTVLIDDVNVEGLASTNTAGTVDAFWKITDTAVVDQSASLKTRKFDIWTCADVAWSTPDCNGNVISPGTSYPTNISGGTSTSTAYQLQTILKNGDTITGYTYAPLPRSNFITVTMEIFSYQFLIAAVTGDYPKFCAMHRYNYYALYMANGSNENGDMGAANDPTYDISPPGIVETFDGITNFTTPYMNRYRSFIDSNGNQMTTYESAVKPHRWAYVSYCPGYLPYGNFLTKKTLTTAPDTVTEPIFYMANPYYKGINDMYSASDADATICHAYKMAHLAFTRSGETSYMGFKNYDDLFEAETSVASDSAKQKVGARTSTGGKITWDFMYDQMVATMLAQSGHQNTYSDTLDGIGNPAGTTSTSPMYSGPPEGSSFKLGNVMLDKYVVTTGHDTGIGGNVLHPDYMDLSLYNDWAVEATSSCFLEGTKILTSRGYVPVEELTKTDQVVSYGDILENKLYEKDIRVVPIRWVGKYSKSKPCPKHQPICITKDSISAGMPFSDVYFSGNHGVVLRKKRVPAKKLIGDKIYKVPFESVVYYHVEVEGHQVISANGVLSETYLETGKRRAFITVFSNV
jgi:hypothetical protein